MNRAARKNSVTGIGELILVAALLLLACIVRLAIARLDHVLQGDEGAYLWLGKTLMTGGGYTFFGRPEMHYTPLYPIVSGLVWLLVRDLEMASKVCFVLFGTLTLIPVYLLSRRIYGWREASATAALLAVLPALTSYVFYWGSMTEPLYFFLVFWAAYASLMALQINRWPTYVAAGALFSLAYLARPEGLVFLAAVWAFLLVARLCDRSSWHWRTAGNLIIMLVAFLIVASPYLLYLHKETGHWTFTGKILITYKMWHSMSERDLVAYDKITWGLDSTGDEVMYHSKEKFTSTMMDEIRSHPREYVAEVLRNARQLDSYLLSKRILPFFLLPLIGLALFRTHWDRRRLWNELYLILLFLVPLVSFLPFAITLRYILGTLFIVMIWVGRGIVELARWVAGTVHELSAGRRNATRWETAVIVVCTAILAGYFLALQPAFIEEGKASMHFNYKIVGEWLGIHTPADATIMARGAIVAIHANRDWEPFPHASYDEVIAYARRHGVDYVVVNEHEFEVMRPHLAFLADPAQAPAELEAVMMYRDSQGATVAYRLLEQVH